MTTTLTGQRGAAIKYSLPDSRAEPLFMGV
jgi:hypothetical protein